MHGDAEQGLQPVEDRRSGSDDEAERITRNEDAWAHPLVGFRRREQRAMDGRNRRVPGWSQFSQPAEEGRGIEARRADHA